MPPRRESPRRAATLVRMPATLSDEAAAGQALGAPIAQGRIDVLVNNWHGPPAPCENPEMCKASCV